MKRKYLLQFEFRSTYDNVYFFPVFVMSEDENEANQISQTISTALKQNYKNVKEYQPKFVIAGINSDFVQNYIDNRMSGRIEILDVSVWQFKPISTNPELNFDQHLELIENDYLFSEVEIANEVAKYRFPVKVLLKNSLFENTEYLLINVVDPNDIPINKEIVILITEDQAKSVNLDLLTESQWLSSGYKDFIYRVERHSADTDRHIHIAHEKHKSTKTKQVSWNQTDGSIHDKKTFNHNFSGINKAKEIARNVLGIPPQITLQEHVITNHLLKESISHISDNFIYLKLII